MCGLVKRVLCFAIVGGIAFVALALWSGGERFRWFGEKTGGAIQKSTEELGERADAIKGKRDATEKKLKEWTGKAEEAIEGKKTGERRHADDPSPKKRSAKTGEQSGDAAAEEKSFMATLRSWWQKIAGLAKGLKEEGAR